MAARTFTTSAEVRVTGFAWGEQPVDIALKMDISRNKGRQLGDFRPVMDGLRKVAGDHADARLHPESFIQIIMFSVRRDRAVRRERCVPLARFPSIADFILKVQ